MDAIHLALELGASVAGQVSLADLRQSQALKGSAFEGGTSGFFILLGYSHPQSEPDLDDWGGPYGTEGNRRLMEISQALCRELPRKFAWRAKDVPYGLDKGGIRLKEAAVLSGIGCFGRNNLLITREFGPRLRLRAVAVEGDFDGHGQPVMDLCKNCAAPCLRSCPQGAFDLGNYERGKCAIQMAWDEGHPVMKSGGPRVVYCRRCEMTCIAGSLGVKR